MKHFLLPVILSAIAIPVFSQKYEKIVNAENRVVFENIPDGDYRVKVTLGSELCEGETTIRGESRRLFFEMISTKQGK